MSKLYENSESEKRKHNSAHKIQTKFIQHIHQKWRKSTQNQHRNQCINEADFLTFQPIQEIPSHALFCIQDRANPYQKETKRIIVKVNNKQTKMNTADIHCLKNNLRSNSNTSSVINSH